MPAKATSNLKVIDDTSVIVTASGCKKYYEASLMTTLESREELKTEIHDLIAPHREGGKPPFSSPELIIMAIIDSDTKYRSRCQVVDWIQDRFRYYDDAVFGRMGALARRGYTRDMEEYALKYIDREFLAAFDAYELPLSRQSRDCGVSATAGKTFLRRWLDSAREGTFRFLDLPGELRNRIYEMLLVFPLSTLCVRMKRRIREECIELAAYERNCGHSISFNGYAILRPSRLLDIALVNKQLARETIPVFFGSNTFAFEGSCSIEKFVRIVSTNRMKLIKNIHISIAISPMVDILWDWRLRYAVDSMLKSTNLDKMGVLVVDSTYRDIAHCMCRESHYRTWQTLRDIPSLCSLARLATSAKKHAISFGPVPAEGGLDLAKKIKEPMLQEIERLRKEKQAASEG